VTFGSYDFKPRDRSAIALPRHVDTLSFVPGVAMQFALRPHWELEPYVEAGIARSSDADLQATTYAGGLRSRYDFEAGRFHAQLYNEIIYAALDFHGSPAHEQFMRLRNGITASRPFESRPSYDYLIYAMADTYAASTQGIPAQFEVGITFGATAPRKLWRIPLPRVGLGYRFGDHLAVPRLVFGAPF
jgi:hypothetical protein